MKTKAPTRISIYGLMFLALLICSAVPAFAQPSTLRTNGKIAFVVWKSDPYSHSGISVMNPDGSGRTQLTSTQILCPPPNGPPGSCGPDHLDYSPSWSPDGKQIAFIRNFPVPGYQGPYDVFVMNADGSNQQRVTQIGSVSLPSRPTWSPDGTQLAFVGPPIGDHNSTVYIINADGSGLRPIGHGEFPAWSPDGSKLAFTTFDGLHLMNPDGSGRTQITAPQSPGDYDLAPVWSPDGTRLLFIRSLGCDLDENCESITIWTVNADGSNPAKLTDIAAYRPLAWSPDGTKIVFRWLGWRDPGDLERDGDLFTIEADGRNITRLTSTPGEYESMPSWQPLASAACAYSNPIDCPDFFVRQQYLDFLGREPDTPGLAHWTSEIAMCSDVANQLSGESEAQCIDRKRANTSGAFYLSNEFQNSANFLIRVNWGSLGQDRAIGRTCIVGQYSALDAVCRPLYSDYISDLAKLTQGIVVNDALDPNAINTNKQNFVNEFVMRADFLAAYPNTLTAEEYVDKLAQTTGIALTTQERADLIAKVGTDGRAAVLYAMVDGTTTIDGGMLRFDTRYGKAYYDQELNPAFVFVEYLGYLRRNPDHAGFDHWLGKLNLYGNFVDAEMVRAFIVSDEYRRRFGPN